MSPLAHLLFLVSSPHSGQPLCQANEYLFWGVKREGLQINNHTMGSPCFFPQSEDSELPGSGVGSGCSPSTRPLQGSPIPLSAGHTRA